MNPASSPGPPDPSGRLDSWKEIAAYLGRTERTVRRWEDSLGLPIHRLALEKRGSVYASRAELDQWWESRKTLVELEAKEPAAKGVPSADAEPATSGSRLRWAAVAAVAVLALGTGIAFWKLRPHSGAAGRIHSIAVLPLRNLSGDPGQEYFSDGATDALISDLAQIQALRVVSFTSVIRYKGTTKPLPEIGRELGVDGIVEGSVQQQGGRIRISAQLVQAATDTHLWAQVYDRERSDMLKAQADVARAIVEEIRGRLSPEENRRFQRYSVTAAAQDEYLLGHDHVWRMNDRDQLEALRHFREAARLQPNYADAYAQIASVFLNRALFTGGIPFREGERPAFEAIHRALDLDPNLAIGHDYKADLLLHYKHDWAGAETEYQRAIALNANSIDARADHACLLAALGRFQEAFSELDRAVALDPQNSFVEYIYGMTAGLARQYDAAERHYRRALDLDPKNTQALRGLVAVKAFQGRFDSALALLKQQAQARGGDLNKDVLAGIIYASMGRRADALNVLTAVTAPGARPYIGAVATLYFVLGDMNQGFKALEKLFDERSPIFAAYDPQWDPVRSDPRFRAQIQRLGVPQ
jgi:TolB-like protein/Tfp pilus assembly protein PilF